MPPLNELGDAAGLAVFCRRIIEATAEAVCAFKPNLAFFLAFGAAGIDALQETLSVVPPHIPVVLDAKVGDIGNTQRLYGRAVFETWQADALTVNPYVGEDAVCSLLEAYAGRGVFVLCRTSNPDAPRFQDHPGAFPRLYERVISATQEWAQRYPNNTVGLVVGATHPTDLASVRAQAPELPLLIPGIGAQGGELDAAVRFGPTHEGLGPLINVSRAVNYASREADYARAARRAALSLRDEINRLRASYAEGD
jgi:orotidine-5'-phosphate decarboxylase